MKIKLKNPNAPAGDAPAAPPPPVEPAAPAAPKPGGLKLKLKPSSATNSPVTADPAAAQGGDAPKAKRKYTKKAKLDDSGNPVPAGKPGPKKRGREDGEDVDAPATKRKPKPTAKSLAMRNDSDDDDDLLVQEPAPVRPQPARTQSIKLSIKPKNAAPSAPQRTGTAILKVKGMGKAPVRPYGVGYDSEAEEAEKDPAIESQFILRMIPGPDCDLLRKSIEEKTIGKSMAHGGPGVYFRFFDREGRRAMITIQGRMYAASMVELPTVIESLKSWNKKDWVKTADVCQMLLVLGKVQSEEEAKKYPRPSYIEPDSHRFPHGITPPMQWARKRRFRPRKSYLDVERAEAEMNRLLVEDENAESTKYDLIDSDEETSGDDSDSEEDAQGDEDIMDTQPIEEQHIEEVDAGDLEQMLAEGFMEDENVELQVDGDALNGLLDQANSGMAPTTPATAHDVALHALQQSGAIAIETETAASTPAAATSADDDDDDDDDDADSDDENHGADDAAEAEEQRKEQLRSEIAELEKAVQSHVDARNAATNKIFKTRKQKEIDKLQADLEIKRRQLGEDLDE